MSALSESVDGTIRARGLFRRGRKILVAVSGGLDSMVLLRLLQRLAAGHKWQLTIAHLNHQLRGRSSDADERLVARTARALRLPLVVERADIKKRAKVGRLSLEMAARQARHEFLARTASRLRIPTVALAHHADDQVELFFLRLFRGSGSEGLAGMKWRGPSPITPKIHLARPLLDQSKASLREFARREKVEFREDASNASPDILRNRVRHELLPLLRRKYQPALDRVVLRVMDILGAENEVTHRAARQWLGDTVKPPESFEDLPLAVQRFILQLELRRHKIPAEFNLVERLRKSPGQFVTVSPHQTVVRDVNGKLHLRHPPTPESNPCNAEVALAGREGEISFGGKRILWKIEPQKTFCVPGPRAGQEIFDADKVGSPFVLRYWRAGDRFWPCGMENAAKLQDLFTNQHIPRIERHKLIVAATAAGEVFWVERLRISERFKLTRQTKNRLIWRWKLD